jgi:hypothetical protein
LTISEYAEYLKTKRKRRRRRRFALILICIVMNLIMISSLFIVKKSQTFGLPEKGASYLWKTPFFEFSSRELEQLLTNGENERYFLFLVSIYWIYHIAGVGSFLSLLSLRFSRWLARKRSSFSYETGLLLISDLRQKIKGFILRPSFIKRNSLDFTISSSEPAGRITPMPSEWYKKSLHQWFKSNAIDKKNRCILYVLNRFDDALIKSRRCQRYVPEFLRALDYLELFYFSVACRADRYLSAVSNASDLGQSETDILYSFARYARPLILKIAKVEAGPKFKPLDFLRKLSKQSLVRHGFAIAVIAGLVMLVGVFIFRIPPTQAFLAWFTVAFGSLTISVGVTAISIARERSKSHE